MHRPRSLYVGTLVAALVLPGRAGAQVGLTDDHFRMLEQGAMRCAGIVCVHAPRSMLRSDPYLAEIAQQVGRRLAGAPVDTSRTAIVRIHLDGQGAIDESALLQPSGVAAADSAIGAALAVGKGSFGTLPIGAYSGTLELLVVVSGTPVRALPSEQQIYAELEVDRPAAPAGGCYPRYPAGLRQGRIEGSVLAQLVVDPSGRADTSTFKALRSTHPEFTAAVKAALPCMRYLPAELIGRRVNQLVQQPFMFGLAR